jgi:hypothetical protein
MALETTGNLEIETGAAVGLLGAVVVIDNPLTPRMPPPPDPPELNQAIQLGPMTQTTLVVNPRIPRAVPRTLVTIKLGQTDHLPPTTGPQVTGPVVTTLNPAPLIPAGHWT